MKKRGGKKDGLIKAGEVLPDILALAGLEMITPVQERLIKTAADIHAGQDDEEIAFHHTVLCQTGLPYRRVSDRSWERDNGFLALRIEAGLAMHPESRKWIELPLPFGCKSRLIMIHFDTLAIQAQSPVIEIEHSMTAFLKRIQGYSPNGKEIAAFRDHASAITGATFRFAASRGQRTFQVDTKIVHGFELWFPRDERQKTLWPSTVRLTDEYFDTLRRHAVPLDYRAVSALQHNALALDIYKWLAQRLHRIPASKPTSIPWGVLYAQFGQGYQRVRKFREVFLDTLKTVLTQYPGAKVDVDDWGVALHLSPPPILKLLPGGGA